MIYPRRFNWERIETKQKTPLLLYDLRIFTTELSHKCCCCWFIPQGGLLLSCVMPKSHAALRLSSNWYKNLLGTCFEKPTARLPSPRRSRRSSGRRSLLVSNFNQNLTGAPCPRGSAERTKSSTTSRTTRLNHRKYNQYTLLIAWVPINGADYVRLVIGPSTWLFANSEVLYMGSERLKLMWGGFHLSKNTFQPNDSREALSTHIGRLNL